MAEVFSGFQPLTDKELEELVDTIRVDEARPKLMRSKLPSRLVSNLSPLIETWCTNKSNYNTVLLALRCMRNLSAFEPSATLTFLEPECLRPLSVLVTSISSEFVQAFTEASDAGNDGTDLDGCGVSSDAQLLAVAAQLLGNAAASSATAAQMVWAHCYPDTFAAAAAVPLVNLQEPLCMTLLRCCQAKPEIADTMLNERDGVQLLGDLVVASTTAVYGADDAAGGSFLCMLVHFLAVQKGGLPELIPKLATRPDAAHVTLLHLLANELEAILTDNADSHLGIVQGPRPSAVSRPQSAGGGAKRGMPVWLAVVQTADEAAKAAVGNGPNAHAHGALVDACLQVLRALTSSYAGHGGSEGDVVNQLMTKHGGLQLLLGLLRDLKPIDNAAARRAAEVSAAAGNTVMQQPSTGGYPRESLYKGYRSDIISVIANAVFGRPTVQNAVLELGGVHLILCQCQLDDESPLAREWALWAVRNLCENNPSVQQAIHDLKLDTAVQTPELEKMGLKVDVDKATGKLEMTKI